MKEIKVNPHQTIRIGQYGENEAREVVFDVSHWIADYGPGTAQLLHRRPGDVDPYPCTLRTDGNTVRWIVQAGDILPGGYGECQLS